MADANRTQLGMVRETDFGVTPSTNLDILRITGGAIVPTQNTVISEEIRADLRAGRPVRTSQLAQGTVNLEWSYGTLDELLSGMLMEDWSSDVLVDGTTPISYTFEDQFLGLTPALYNTYAGSRIAALSLDMALDAIVSGSFGIMTAIPTLGQSSSAAPGTNTPTTTGPWNTVDMVETLDEFEAGGSPFPLSRVTGLTLNMTRALREKREFGNLNAWDIGVGRLIVSGTITQHFQGTDLLDAWSSFEDRSLTIEFGDEDNNTLLIEIPKLKYVGDLNVENPGVDTDRLVTANFEAYADAGDAALIRFTRTDG